MKKWLLTISVVLCALLSAAYGGYWVWRGYYSAEQFRAAVAEGMRHDATVLTLGRGALCVHVGTVGLKSLKKRFEPALGPIRDVLSPCFALAQDAGVSIMLWKRLVLRPASAGLRRVVSG